MRLHRFAWLALVLPIACSSGGGSSGGSGGGSATTSGTCPWHGNCTSQAPNGAFDCASQNELVQCVDGKWEHVTDCSLTQDSKGYVCSCTGGCGTDQVECDFAFNICDGQKYPTCGPNAHPVVTNYWVCEDGSSSGSGGGGGSGGGSGTCSAIDGACNIQGDCCGFNAADPQAPGSALCVAFDGDNAPSKCSATCLSNSDCVSGCCAQWHSGSITNTACANPAVSTCL